MACTLVTDAVGSSSVAYGRIGNELFIAVVATNAK